MLRVGFSERGNMDRVLIFTRTKHGADRVVKQLAQSGIPANAIHGNKSQPQRERALAEFKGGRVEDPDRHRHRRARHRRLRRQPRHQFRPAQRVRAICPPHRPDRARRRGRRRHRLIARGRAGLSQGHREADPPADRDRCRCRPISSPRRTGSRRPAPPPPEPSRQERREEERARAPLPPAARPSRPGPLRLGGQADGRQPPAASRGLRDSVDCPPACRRAAPGRNPRPSPAAAGLRGRSPTAARPPAAHRFRTGGRRS